MMRHAIQSMLAAVLAALLIFSLAQAAGREVKVILFNGKSVEGELLEETPDHVLILTDIGQIKTRRSAIESILYLTGSQPAAASGTADSVEVHPLNDLVVAHLLNGEIVSGYLLSKSLDSILLNSEAGRLTIPKSQVRLIEYVNTEFAERGEPVTARLTSGSLLQGYIYHEDRESVTLETNLGRLTVDKKKLRSIEYHTPVKPVKPPRLAKGATEPREIAPQALSTPGAPAPRAEPATGIKKRQDSFFLGYAPQFGESYHSGLGVGYCNRYLLRSFESFSLNASARLGMYFFSLDKDLAEVAEVPGSMTAEGGAMITTLSLGAPLHFFPSENPSYVFILRPALETHAVYTSLKKSYPSFPSQNSEAKATEFRFGLGTEVGLEWAINPRWSLGFSFAMHFIASDNDYNTFNIAVGTQLY